MEDDREMRDGEAMIQENGSGERERYRDGDRERGGDRDRDRSRDRSHRDRDRSRSRDRRHRDEDRHRSHRHHSRSRSRSRSPGRRHRHRSYSRSRSRSRDRDRRDRDRDGHRDRERKRPSPVPFGRTRFGGGRHGGDNRPEGERSMGGPMNAPREEAEAHAAVSKREGRLYVGNLAYDCTYKDLEKFMKAAGDVVFTEILTTPAGASKGCGIVEYASAEEADRAKTELAEKMFMGRAVHIREDREEAARFGQAPIPGKMGVTTGESRGFQHHAPNPNNRNLFIGNLPLQASWQDLKDLMRQAGEVVRTDVGMYPDGTPKGNGTVVFAQPEDAKAAIGMFNGFDWFGNVLEVREDRFANAPFRGGFRGGFGGGFRGGFQGPGGFGGRGGFQGGPGGFRGGFGGGFRGGFRGGMNGGFGGRGGYAAGGGGGRNFSNDIYADYNGPDGGAMAVDGANGAAAGSGLQPITAEPNQQILVRNLPWSTSNEDLVELFETVGTVVLAEILYAGDRSKGEGIVQFTETAEAQTAGEKFTGYTYGGRPLDVQFNPRWHDFTATASKGGQAAA